MWSKEIGTEKAWRQVAYRQGMASRSTAETFAAAVRKSCNSDLVFQGLLVFNTRPILALWFKTAIDVSVARHYLCSIELVYAALSWSESLKG
ncbi:MAG TPA: hypothetical protein DCM64_04255 [Gammaproteobacteria bacterium]|nr:hypothetical protein [Gammaproteobacteria bacterium]